MTNNIENHNTSLASEAAEPFNLRHILSKYLFHWPIFFVGIFGCLSLAFLFLRYAQPVYSVESTLLIKDNKNSKLPPGGDLLSELDLFGGTKVVDNEIEILKSKTLMRNVVDRLNLSISLKTEGRLKNLDLYSGDFLNIDIVQLNRGWYGKKFDLSFPTTSTYQVIDNESGAKVSGKLDQLQKTALGVYKISKNENFAKLAKAPITITINDPEFVVNDILNKLSILVTSKQSAVLKISLQTAVPERGQDVLNTLIQVYNEAALADKNKTTANTIEFIDQRLKLITGELTDVERDVETFKSSRGLTDLSNDAKLFLESVRVNDEKLNEVNLKISVIRDIERFVNSNTSGEKAPSTLGIDDPVLLAQINKLGELQLIRDNLLATTTPLNPVLAPVNQQLETTRASIRSSISNIYKALRISQVDLQKYDAHFQESIKKVPGQERQLISIKRQQTIKESLYLYLLQKKEEAALSYASAIADSRTVDPAFYSKIPVKPKGAFIYLASLLAGLILPIGYIYLKDILNVKIQNREDILTTTTAPIVGEIFFNEEAQAIVVNESSRTAVAEQFRSIRTNMQFLHGKQTDGVGRVTLFTSGMSGEGKTFVASNIAAALAISGRRTVLLELDLRKPKVSKYLNLLNIVGLSNFFIGAAKIDQILQLTNISPNLYVIGSGPLPPNPSELLVRPDVESLMTYLKANFDDILIDTPPIGLVTDAQILSRFADVTFYILRQGISFKEQVKNIEYLYKGDKFKNLNIILNGVRLDGQHGYGYGYGYGYYSDDLSNKSFQLKTIIKNILKRF